jgi:hypothetical protein
VTVQSRRGAAFGLALLLGGFGACSLQNREGPDVTCADLQCGKVNACEEGIIASCSDGVTLRFHVCDSSDDEELCDEDWQTDGQYKCDEDDIECEGCGPGKTVCP